MKRLFPLILFLSVLSIIVNAQLSNVPAKYTDTAFWQEYHEIYRVDNKLSDNDIRSIAIDGESGVWIATATGVYRKEKNKKDWERIIKEKEKGPAYHIMVDNSGTVWIGTWNGVYSFKNNSLHKIPGASGPISAICKGAEGVFAFGPKGVWQYRNGGFKSRNFAIARSIRNVMAGADGSMWVASDVGLYQITQGRVKHFMDTSVLISAYIKGLALDSRHRLWAGGLGGVSILQNGQKIDALHPSEGIPSIYVNCVRSSPEGVMWVGTDVGVVRYAPDGTHSLLFTRRWLLDDKVKDIAFDQEGNAWVATNKGVSAIKRKKMTLLQKQDFFYDITMKRHIREPWISGPVKFENPEDLNSWQPEDDDNDGEFTGTYLAMESFRFAATKSADAKEKAKKAFEFLKLLQTITGTDGFFARTIVPVSWGDRVHDPNTTYTEQELAEELVKEPRFKPVTTRWHTSKDGKWLWKGDTSSDEWCGHMLGYYFYYELVANDKFLIQFYPEQKSGVGFFHRISSGYTIRFDKLEN